MKSYSVNRKENYRFTVLLAVLLHIFLFSALFLTLHRQDKPLFSAASAPTIIHATAVASNQLPVFDTSEKSIIKPSAEIEKIVTKPALIEKSPLTLPVQEKKSRKISTPSVVPKPRVITATIKRPHPDKLHPDKLVQRAPLAKEKNTSPSLSSKSLQVAQKNAQQLLQQEVNTWIQKQQTAAGNRAITEKYRHLILQSIAQQWIIPPELNKHLETRLAVHLAPGGMVLEVTVIKSSGNTVLDRSAQTAVYKASPLPVPKNMALFNAFKEINLTVRPEGIITQ